MKNRIVFAFLLITLAACTPIAEPAETPAQPTLSALVAAVTTADALTQAARFPSPPPTVAIVTPSPLPTQPVFPVITPDAAQVERWKEYEDALAKTFFSYLPPAEVVCEWVILGRANLEVYVYAYCAGIYSSDPSQASIPAVIHIGIDGSVQSVKIPGAGSDYGPDIRRMFPKDVQDKIFGQSTFLQELTDRLRWRRGHPDETPWIIFSSLQIQPTQPVIPIITPDPIQVTRWKEYQTALAKVFFSYLPPERVICEWEILGQSDQEVYVWAICTETRGVGSSERLAVINVDENGNIHNATTAGIGGADFPSEIRQTFPPDVQERYFDGLIHFQELVDHLRWRQYHPEEPPLSIASATPVP
ncbi:MAG: hypothetical protein ACOYYU_01380 [Chloroflexota bacterium]